MQTVTLPNRLLDQAKAAAGTRSARAVVIRALEKFIAQETEFQPGPELARKILAQKNHPAPEYGSARAALRAALGK